MDDQTSVKVSTATVIDYVTNNDELNLTIRTCHDHDGWVEIIPDQESKYKICFPKFVIPELINVLKTFQK